MQFLQCLCIGNGSDTPKRNSLKRTSSGKQAQNPEGNMIKNKILILGPGDSGKSTMFKNIRIHLQHGFPNMADRYTVYKPIVIDNIIKSAMNLVNMMARFGLEPEEQNRKTIQFFQKLSPNIDTQSIWNQQLSHDVKKMWSDKGIQETYNRRREFLAEYILDDSARYFLDQAEKIGENAWIPENKDVLMCRRKTTGIVEDVCVLNGITVKFMDVGGQRNERKKWIHCFEDVTAVIFVVSLSEYDQHCYEESSMNRMHESLNVWEETIKLNWFVDTPFVLLFNKSDLLREKIQTTDLNVCFKDYTDGLDYEKAKQFITKKFLEKNRTDKVIPTFYSNATEVDGNASAMHQFILGLGKFLQE